MIIHARDQELRGRGMVNDVSRDYLRELQPEVSIVSVKKLIWSKTCRS